MTRIKSKSIEWSCFRQVAHIKSGTSLSPRKFPPVPKGVGKVKKAVTRRRKKRGKTGPRKKKKVKKAVTKYKVKRLVRRLDDMGKRFFEVEWEGYSEIDNTVEPRESLMLDVKGLVEKYERENGCVLN